MQVIYIIGGLEKRVVLTYKIIKHFCLKLKLRIQFNMEQML